MTPKPIFAQNSSLPLSLVSEADDAGLSVTVTIWEPRLFLYKVLNVLSQQSKVTLSISPEVAVSGLPVTLFCRERKLCDVMNALASFLSVRDHLYQWKREGKSGSYRYHLEPSRAALELHKTLLARLQNEYENHIDLLIRLAKLPPEKRAASQNELLISMGREGQQQDADYLLKSEEFWERILLFDSLLSPAQQKRVLRREEIAQIPFSKLSASDRERLQKTQGNSMSARQVFAENADTTQTNVTILTRMEPHFAGDIVPRLYIGITHGRTLEYLGLDSSGFRQRGVRDYLQSIWPLPTDTEPAKERNRIIIEQKTKPEENTKVIDKSFSQWIQALNAAAKQTEIAIIAHFVPRENSNLPPISLNGLSWKQAEEQANNSWEVLLTKWDGNFLFLRDPSWVQDETYLLPARSMAVLELLLSEKSPTLKDIANVIGKMSLQQYQTAIKEFPTVEALPHLLSLLGLSVNAPDIIRSAGVELNIELLSTMRKLPGLAGHGLLKDNAASKARIMVKPRNNSGKLVREYRLELFAEKERRWLPVFGVPLPVVSTQNERKTNQ